MSDSVSLSETPQEALPSSPGTVTGYLSYDSSLNSDHWAARTPGFHFAVKSTEMSKTERNF